MKPITLITCLLVALCLTSCSKAEEQGECSEVSYNIPFDINVGSSYCLPDGTELALQEVQDHRCPCEVSCFWAGEFIFLFDVIRNGESTPFMMHEHDEMNEELTEITFTFNQLYDAEALGCPGSIDLTSVSANITVAN